MSGDRERLRLVPYVRVSEDPERKGQNPDRQVAVIEEWAEREGVVLLEPVVDEGSSASKADPFEREAFVRACELGQGRGAHGVVVETADRFTRLDSEMHGWAKVEMSRRYGLELFFSDLTVEEHGSFAGRLRTSLNVESGHRWVREHARKVRSGMAAAREGGQHVGRPSKELSEEELELVDRLREENGWGWRRCAHRVNRSRGALELADPAARKRRSVSHMTVKRRFEEWNGDE